jgi:hypothetical protein
MIQAMLGALRAASPPAPKDAPPPPGLPFTDPDELLEAMNEAGFQNVAVEEQEQPQHVHDVEAFWREWVDGSAPVQLLRAQVGEAEWSQREQIAIAHLTSTLGELPAELTSRAYIATGRKLPR